ncbi:hypothetical protein LTR17_022298 [Elasticomyces elasticus]|nr:hypothetical protein LTR17_022298 [Elasticomyces elasticus]
MNTDSELAGEQFELQDGAAGGAPQSLPPTDRGKDAYSVLAGCFLAEVFTWCSCLQSGIYLETALTHRITALPYSYGVFTAYYSRTGAFSTETGSVAAIGTTLVGLMMFLSPLPAWVAQMWPQYRRRSMAMGLLLAVASLVGASFCDNADALLATQGVLYAVGGVFAYFPCFSFLDEWFVHRKGLAYGAAWAGTGLGGSVAPFVINWLLNAYGHRTALRVWAVIELIGVGTAILLVKNRLPSRGGGTPAFRLTDLSFLKYAPFWIFQAANIVQALGSYLPMLYISSFAADIGLPPYSGSIALALYSISTCCGCLLLGNLVDRFHVSTVILLATLAQLVAIFVFWGLTNGQAMLYLFAIIYGVFGGAAFVTWPGCAWAIRNAIPSCHVDMAFVLSLLTAGKGLGSVIGGPIGIALMNAGWQGEGGSAYSSDFAAVIVFTGVSSLLGGLAWVGRVFRIV